MAMMPSAAKRDVLAATSLFASLSRDELESLAALAAERRVGRDATVMRRGDPEASLMVLVHGRLRAGTGSADGREVTIGLLESGAVLGEIALLDGQPRSLDVTAMMDSLLLVVERRDFLPFLSARPGLMLKLMVLLCDRLRRASAAFEDVALASLSARLAKLLLGLAERHGTATPQGVRIRLRLSQRDMSAQVAATRERVNKQLRQWHESGVLGDMDGDLLVRRPAELQAISEGHAAA